MVETTSCYMAARVVENKSYTGSKDQKVAMVEEFIKETGYKNITLQCDGESTIWYLIEGIAARFPNLEGTSMYTITARQIAPSTSNANGSVERSIRIVRDQIRVIMGHLTDRLGIRIDPNSKFIPWAVRHCTWQINNMLPMKSFKGTTRWEIIKGRRYTDRSQQDAYAGDKGMAFAHIDVSDIRWGS